MADVKLSALTELAAAAAVGDELYIRDISEAAADESKRITTANLINGGSGSAKLWGHIDRSAGTPSLDSPSFNISSVADGGAGQTTVNIGTDMGSAVYVVTANADAVSSTADIITVESMLAGSFLLECRDEAANLLDTTDYMCVGHGDQ